MTFDEWFNSAPHRKKYTTDHPVYLAALEAWEAAHEACAKSCEDVWNHRKGLETGTALECVVAIRARAQ